MNIDDLEKHIMKIVESNLNEQDCVHQRFIGGLCMDISSDVIEAVEAYISITYEKTKYGEEFREDPDFDEPEYGDWVDDTEGKENDNRYR
jgi:hypothetical protein